MLIITKNTKVLEAHRVLHVLDKIFPFPEMNDWGRTFFDFLPRLRDISCQANALIFNLKLIFSMSEHVNVKSIGKIHRQLHLFKNTCMSLPDYFLNTNKQQ